MSKRDNRIVKDAVNWISKIRPEYQIEELTKATQKSFIKQAKGMQGICLACVMGFTGALLANYAIDKRVGKLEEKILKMQMDIDCIEIKINDKN